MTSPTQMPATNSGSSGHQVGVDEKPTASGIEVKVHPWRSWVSFRNQYAPAAIGTARITARTKSRTYARDRMIASGSGGAVAGGAVTLGNFACRARFAITRCGRDWFRPTCPSRCLAGSFRNVFLDYTPEQRALRAELRAYLAELMSPEVRETIGSPGEGSEAFRPLVRRLGKDGWLGLGWPKEYGGQGRPAIDQYIMFDEVQRAGVPFPFVTVTTIGPALMRFGTEEQKAAYLPGMLSGDLNFAVGYSEPSAGTDLASLRTSAVLDGDEWVINGAKVFTSGANQADYIWLACRSEPDLPKHKGISIILVPTNAAGFRWTPIVTVGDVQTTATYYDDVRVPRENLVGERGGGWRMITTQLNHERVGLAALGGRCWRLWAEVREWARTTPAAEGGVVLDRPWVRADLARCFTKLE